MLIYMIFYCNLSEIYVRNQLLEIDFTNTTVTAEVDTIESGGSSAGTGYTTTSSY